MTLCTRWVGPPPRVGEYLMPEVRPRYAYRVEQVTASSPNVLWDPVAKAEVHRIKIVVDRVAMTAVPKHVRIHPWKWDRREARARGAAP